MCIVQFSFLQFLGSFIFGHFWPFFDTFGIFGTLVEIWGILWVLVSYEVTRWIILVLVRVYDGFGGFKKGFGVVLRVLWESAIPLKGTFCPSRILVQHQIFFQTPHNGPTGQSLQGRHYWSIFGQHACLLYVDGVDMTMGSSSPSCLITCGPSESSGRRTP